MPALPLRALTLALLATLACAYAIVRHYTTSGAARGAPRSPPQDELPAPEVVPLENGPSR